jgi:hypothetical protein
MPTQLTFDFNAKPLLDDKPMIPNNAWLDVSEIARGVGFTETVKVSVALNDALRQKQNETESEYDQRLYDAVWLAHFQLSLDRFSCVTFLFIFQQTDWQRAKTSEVRLRVRAESQKEFIFIGLLPDF